MKLNLQPLPREFYARDTVQVARDLLGKYLVLKDKKFVITETEAYCGEKDLACHGAWRRKQSCENLWGQPGRLYIYLTYGLHYMLNISTEKENYPAAVLIRGLDKINGPGRVTKFLGINKSHDGLDITSGEFFIADGGQKPKYAAALRVGVAYAGLWAKKLWRFIIKYNNVRQS
ncbi:DNA-3-methyladenine glycosylase [Candidatus Gottesmanbacteria bacterium]|nr:DNA-3-methyladenine glycosylase [Candidatus Gottesmanbacteria bacterium]